MKIHHKDTKDAKEEKKIPGMNYELRMSFFFVLSEALWRMRLGPWADDR